MAKPKKVQEVEGGEELSEEVVAQLDAFPNDKLLFLKLGSVDVPVVEEGRGFFKNVSQKDWNMKYQTALFDYWKEVAADHPGFNIEAKKAKLFISGE